MSFILGLKFKIGLLDMKTILRRNENGPRPHLAEKWVERRRQLLLGWEVKHSQIDDRKLSNTFFTLVIRCILNVFGINLIVFCNTESIG